MTHPIERADLQSRSLRHRLCLLPLDVHRLRAGLVADALLDAMDLLDLARTGLARGDVQRVISALLAASAAACTAITLGEVHEGRLQEAFQQQRYH